MTKLSLEDRLVGRVIENSLGQVYEIVGLLRIRGRKPQAVVRFKVSGNTWHKDYQHAERGKILDKDNQAPRTTNLVCGVGVSFQGAYKNHRRAYRKWDSMISRCYGNRILGPYKGVTVCKRWLVFRNFLEDLPSLPGYDLFLNGRCHLDKDLISPGNKEYGPEVCCFVTGKANMLGGTESSAIKTRKRVRLVATGEEYESQTEAALKCGTTCATVSLHCLGKVREPRWEFC